MRTLSRRQFTRLAAASPLLLRGASLDGALPTRPLGKMGFKASILGLGGQRVGDQPTAQAIVDRIVAEAIEHGLNYVDTARGYGPSEERLGRALKGKRDKVFLVSKTRSATREAALADLKESLRNLQTDHLDCLLIHNISREDGFPNFEETLSEKGALGALLEAKKQGMIRHIGCSAHTYPAFPI
ncbi:MAG: aldo/keto reductase [Acidobacteriota bacterium]